MEEEKFGEFIKEIRKKNNLTQKDLASKYHVTYQAVSKWENGKNMPDKVLIKQMAKDFNVSIEGMFDGKYEEKKKFNILFIIIPLLALLIILLILIFNNNNDFEFKTLSAECSNFTISGSIAYNKSKSAIYIDNIKYCGGDDNTTYKSIECTLYELYNNTDKKISSYTHNKEITLEEFLKKVTFTVDNYLKDCEKYTENSLYLEINATNQDDKIITYKIPLKLQNACFN